MSSFPRSQTPRASRKDISTRVPHTHWHTRTLTHKDIDMVSTSLCLSHPQHVAICHWETWWSHVCMFACRLIMHRYTVTQARLYKPSCNAEWEHECFHTVGRLDATGSQSECKRECLHSRLKVNVNNVCIV